MTVAPIEADHARHNARRSATGGGHVPFEKITAVTITYYHDALIVLVDRSTRRERRRIDVGPAQATPALHLTEASDSRLPHKRRRLSNQPHSESSWIPSLTQVFLDLASFDQGARTVETQRFRIIVKLPVSLGSYTVTTLERVTMDPNRRQVTLAKSAAAISTRGVSPVCVALQHDQMLMPTILTVPHRGGGAGGAAT